MHLPPWSLLVHSVFLRISRRSRLSWLFIKPPKTYINFLTEWLSSTRGVCRTLVPLIRPGNTLLIWATSLPVDKQLLNSSLALPTGHPVLRAPDLNRASQGPLQSLQITFQTVLWGKRLHWRSMISCMIRPSRTRTLCARSQLVRIVQSICPPDHHTLLACGCKPES